MTASAPFDPGNRDRFFRSMVLMGSSLALGCAGTSIHDGSPREDADDIAARAGTGGSAGTTSSAAGSAGMATSGSAGMATSGTGAGGAATTPVCPDEQRTCAH